MAIARSLRPKVVTVLSRGSFGSQNLHLHVSFNDRAATESYPKVSRGPPYSTQEERNRLHTPDFPSRFGVSGIPSQTKQFPNRLPTMAPFQP